ncbi:MAG: TonB-dependent receptor [Gammaproteobacteria bacterium]|nr:MAG: TonB-dependent receptor [Gammaproteobacteria bacterium]
MSLGARALLWIQRAVLLAPSCASLGAAHSATGTNPAEALEMPTVEVVGTTPLPGLGTPIQDVPANVQIYTSGDLARQRQSTLTDYLEHNPSSVTSNAAQGNPLQPDIGFRGFTASPLLGTPQGLSVFQDGVRVNEPFGDVVNWDLIPQSAISSIQLIPGSNPAFGLNTLGGALAIYTKSGAQYPGGGVEVSGGSFGRETAELEWGGARGALDYFLTGNYFDDRGWADHNPSRVQQFFGKAGWQDERTDLDASLTLVDNRLQGTQTLPQSFLEDIRQAYTFPDINSNRLTFVTVKGSRFLAGQALLGGNLYYRNYRTRNFNSNVNSNFGQIDPATGVPDPVQATNDIATIDERSYGAGLQLTLTGAPAGKKNQLTVGASGDIGHARFIQDSQDAAFSAQRETVGNGSFALATGADTSSRDVGVFAAAVAVMDRTGLAPLLNGEHAFARFNPAVGLNFNPAARLTVYGSYNEGMRAPTAIELTCADPAAPCKLPNDFLADPALAAVVSRTAELGARGTWSVWHWSAAAYRTNLRDDIQFISSGAGATNAGFFANIGATRRSGTELAAAARLGRWSLAARYSFIDATFQSAFTESSPSNSSADANGAIQVRAGDQIPGVPRHTLKLRVDCNLTERWSAGTSILASSGVYARGDENNSDRNGRLPGYTLLNLDTRYAVTRALEVFARVNNLFDRRYYNFALLGQNVFTGPDRTFGPAAGVAPRDEQFRGPGTPRGVWVGARYTFGGSERGPGNED